MTFTYAGFAQPVTDSQAERCLPPLDYAMTHVNQHAIFRHGSKILAGTVLEQPISRPLWKVLTVTMRLNSRGDVNRQRQIGTILGNRQCYAVATMTATMNDSVFNIRAAGAGSHRYAIIDMEHDDYVYN